MPANNLLAEDVFKFISIRPPQRLTLTTFNTRFAYNRSERDSTLRQAMAVFDGTEGASAKAVEVARAFMNSTAYVAHPAKREENFRSFEALQKVIEDVLGKADPTSIVIQAVNDHLGMPVSDYVKRQEFRDIEEKLWEGLYANTVAARDRPDDREPIMRAIRLAHLLRNIAGLPSGSTRLPASLDEFLTATLLLPRDLYPRSKMPAIPKQPAIDPKQKNTFVQELRQLQAAIGEIRGKFNEHQARLIKPASPRGETVGESLRDSSRAQQAQAGPKSQEPFWRRESLSRFSASSAQQLSATTRDLVANLGLSFELSTVPEVLETFEDRARRITAHFAAIRPRSYAYRLGNVYVSSDKVPDIPEPVGVGELPPGRIENKGIADLMVVKQTLLRYVEGEVAHIENVLQSEDRKRSHRRLSRTEEDIVRVLETTKENERDLQTTERFEMQRETQQTIQTDANVQAGITVTAGFGPVETTSSANYSLQTSRTDSSRIATNYAKEVTERSVARIMERTREERIRRTIEEFEEINSHNFNNTDGQGHIRGVYRWVDKIYQAQVVNYGRRLMLEFIVPEPAAFYRYAEQHRSIEGVTLERPEPPMVIETRPDGSVEEVLLQAPEQLDRINYVLPLGRYNVEGVSPPPPATRILGTAIEQPAAQSDVFTKVSSELQVPDGYVAAGGEAHSIPWAEWSPAISFDLQVGNNLINTPSAWFTLNWETETIPLSVLTNVTAYVVNIEITCGLRPETFVKWQINTFNAIMAAYQQREATYREQIAAAMIRQSVAIGGRNPARNREIEKEELKKACIRIMSGEDFSGFDAMNPGGAPPAYPEFNVQESMQEGRKIQFFEQAFEWDQLTYLFYPYFWGRKDRWIYVRQLEDTDPLFSKFLQAGAARVLVPVRPAFNDAVLQYLSTAEPPDDPWNGGDAPIINDPLYISLADELREQTGGRTDGIPVGPPWEIKVPTSLVYLQGDGSLPDFTRSNP